MKNRHLRHFFALITGGVLFGAVLFMAEGVQAQETGTVRGFVYDKENGEPIIFTNVYIEGTTLGAATDNNGYFSINEVPAGEQVLMTRYVGYDTAKTTVQVRPGKIVTQQLYLEKKAVELKEVDISAERQAARTEVQASTIKITPKQIKRIPAAGGEPDLLQYLQVLPGVIFTGEQGGQLYIRGGSPIQNKILLDGMTIYNPFHSIGFFSVFETDIIRNVDIYTGGFGSEYGNRISAVIDIKTRDGNKKRLAGDVSANPFLSKFLIEGPIKKLEEEGGGSASFILTGKHSYLNHTSKALYPYADGGLGVEQEFGLPYSFTDLYGKTSLNAANGSQVSFFGFKFRDRVNFTGISELGWDANGFGSDFVLVPGTSPVLIQGRFAYSDYTIGLDEGDGRPRNSHISGFDMGMKFTYFLNEGEVNYGIDMIGFKTEFEFVNPLGITLDQVRHTTELGGYMDYRRVFHEKFVFNPGLRLHYYATLNMFSPEPRLGMKYNVTDRFRLKAAGGLYSQNLISTISDRDVVALFMGFLSGPDVQLNDTEGNPVRNNVQRAAHAVLGAEYDLTRNLSVNLEGYYKNFMRLINLNRNKMFHADPDYVIETGDAGGGDLMFKYDYKRWYFWLAYSLGVVTRYDGEQTYFPAFDRRHNLNLLGSYRFGEGLTWELSARWNFGSGFPFTQTQGFYERQTFQDGISGDYATGQGQLGIIYGPLNEGRLPYYHRLDVSLRREIPLTINTTLEMVASVTNIYNRNNIFYFDRVRYQRVDQLPILPSIGASLSF